MTAAQVLLELQATHLLDELLESHVSTPDQNLANVVATLLPNIFKLTYNGTNICDIAVDSFNNIKVDWIL